MDSNRGPLVSKQPLYQLSHTTSHFIIQDILGFYSSHLRLLNPSPSLLWLYEVTNTNGPPQRARLQLMSLNSKQPWANFIPTLPKKSEADVELSGVNESSVSCLF